MKLISIFAIIGACVLMVSCKSLQVDSNAKRLELGMTKQEVLSVMGNGYELVHGSVDEEGNGVEILDYPVNGEGVESIYKLYFLNGKLNRWDKEWIAPPEPIIFPIMEGVVPQ